MSTVTNSSFIATTLPMKTSPSAKFLAEVELIRSPNSDFACSSLISPSSKSKPFTQAGTSKDFVVFFVVAIYSPPFMTLILLLKRVCYKTRLRKRQRNSCTALKGELFLFLRVTHSLREELLID